MMISRLELDCNTSSELHLHFLFRFGEVQRVLYSDLLSTQEVGTVSFSAAVCTQLIGRELARLADRQSRQRQKH